ncbi:uncharacterized protein LOC130807559 [Amaranthus tricolor]|uniref:uncharacterized protein LOC130807559 n=1 Tax=Amaranthus tricolor TaxID=29722 RepID=UPI00258EFDFB|nr:uncharacterized protein LOC130807559 [Amaranthus tricolor]
MSLEVGVLTVLQETMRIPFRNKLFTSFIILTSLPFLLLMIYLEIHFERSSTKVLKFLAPSPYHQKLWGSVLSYLLPDLNKDYPLDDFIILPFLPLIYLFLLHVLDFLVAILTIDFSSSILQYKNDRNPIGLQDKILRQSVIGNRERLKGLFVTCLFALLLSTFLLLGFILLPLSYFGFCDSFYYLISTVVYLPVFIICFPKYLELNVVWNMSLVLSVWQKVHGIDAFSLSFYLCKGNEKVGRRLMLIFLVSGFGLRISRVFFDDGVIGVISRTSLLWLAILMKWVVCVIYYHHCKQSKGLVAEIDEEVGGMATCIEGQEENYCQSKLAATKVSGSGFREGAIVDLAQDKDID